ncbi:RHS repeat-associated core domain-containing protein [Streptomyces sp. SP17KL33]|uniref:RHS repeat-associated core domain-containing protein n=1 Tax=Streptomyces sp. SP17KL33 TaxID=3002534 RepID=UPI003FCD9200
MAVHAVEPVPRSWRGNCQAKGGHRWAKGSHGPVQDGSPHYDPQIGRFNQPDPSGQETNPYLDAKGDPVNNSDSSGLWSWWVGLDACFWVCLGGGYSKNASGNSGGYLMIGVGLPGIGGGFEGSKGGADAGPSAYGGCAAGLGTVGGAESGVKTGLRQPAPVEGSEPTPQPPRAVGDYNFNSGRNNHS